MKRIQEYLLRHAKTFLVGGLIVLVGAGIYGAGLFSELPEADNNFFANSTESAKVNTKVEELFNTDDSETSVILFEAKDRTADVRSEKYAAEVARLLDELNAKTVISYYTTGANQFVSKEFHDTYVAVTLDGSNSEQYDTLNEFANSVESDLFTVSIGGTLVGKQQTQDQIASDLTMAELISLPILAILLFIFFRSPVAAAIPLSMSILTIAGALALVRLINTVFPIDNYTLNVITILSVGLAVDYSLLAVNRFREELDEGHSPKEAALKTMQTAGRTVAFSGLTVMICLLALLFFPVGFMHSVSIGGAAAILVAMTISSILLPLALESIGTNINKWSLKRNTSVKGWTRLANTVTKRPVATIIVGVFIIAGLVWPVHYFKTATFDWHVLPSNQSAYHVGQVIDENFEDKTPTLTVLAEFPEEPTVEQLCNLAKTVSEVEGVDSIQAAYAPTEQLSDCAMMPMALTYNPAQAAIAEAAADSFVSGSYARVEVVPAYTSNDSRVRDVMDNIETASYADGVSVSLTGMAAQSWDTLDVYIQWLPYVIGVIILAMVIVLSLLLGSVMLPLQAVVINSLALFISLGVLIMMFQFGWGTEMLGMTITGGFELSIPILIFVIAFGLSMDYAVFLYSRMHEIYDLTGDPDQAIGGGVVKTGPIITAAALLLFAVVAAFATSRIALIQQIGIGLAIAVLVDAFFVRIFFVPAAMKLFGKASWWGPKWLKNMTIKHD